MPLTVRELAAITIAIAACGCSHGAATQRAETPRRAQAQRGALGGPGAGELAFSVVSPNTKIRPQHQPRGSAQATLFSARNEFEAFQVVLVAKERPVSDISVTLEGALRGPDGATIAADYVTLYRVAYYEVGVASNSEGAPGLWPDPLIPAVDTYVGQRRRAFPFDVPLGQSRVVWVDVLVPRDVAPGRYEGALRITRRGLTLGVIPIVLEVADFALPSTASLRSAFGMDYAQPCLAHTGRDTCAATWDEAAASHLRELYLRAALDHRFTIQDPTFQPPFGDSFGPFAKHVLPLIEGRGATRLPGAKLTAIRIDDKPENLGRWLSLAKRQRFFDRLFYFPVDEPSEQDGEWPRFSRLADALHGLAGAARIALTAPIKRAQAYGLAEKVDIFVPVINHLEPRPEHVDEGTPPSYQRWLGAKPGRELWSYQSCMSHGCGRCRQRSDGPDDSGWPSRVIDSTAVQNRAFPWLAFTLGVSGELYFNVAEQLETAWDPDGQCKFSGSGDGTLFYPGTPTRIGGQDHIPIESIRMKLIREGMEDYEYLILAARKDPERARAIARELFPKAYACDQPAARLEAARRQLFELITGATTSPVAGAVP